MKERRIELYVTRISVRLAPIVAVGMFVTPSPISPPLFLISALPFHGRVVLLFPIAVPRTLFVGVPLMVIFAIVIIIAIALFRTIALIAMIVAIAILSRQREHESRA